MPFTSLFKLLITILVISRLQSCKPVIHSFSATPQIVTGIQKVNLKWNVEGLASLQFEEHMSTDSVMLLNFRLTVEKGGKTITQTETVERFKDTIVILFETDSIEDDFIIAKGERNNNKWGKFKIVSLENTNSREIIVSHNDRTTTVSADGSPNLFFSGTTAGGTWIFKTKMTENEKVNLGKRPGELKIKAVIKLVN